jgi:hypothetical protein
MPTDPSASWPIVVGGCHRSGTTLLRHLLDSHSRIHCAPEVKLFHDLYGDAPDRLREIRFMHTVRSLAGEDDLVEVLGNAFVELHERAARAAAKPRWADKAPENIRFWPQWQRVLGDEWWLVHVVRNPLDTIASMMEARFYDVPADVLGCVAHYDRALASGATFAARHPARYRLVFYEQLVEEPESALRSLMVDLGEQFEPGQLAFNRSRRPSGLEDPKIARTTGVHSDSRHAWRSRLSPADSELIWDLTAEAWSRVDPAGQFVDPPSEPSIDP